MNMANHKALARSLIKAAGGLDAAALVAGISTSQLSRYCTPGHPDTMTAAVMAALEEHAGAPVYSGALAEAVTSGRPSSLRDGAEEAVEAAARTLGAIRTALADGRIDGAEREAIRRQVGGALREMLEVMTALDAGVGP